MSKQLEKYLEGQTPITEVEFAEKAKAGTLTFREAFNFAMFQPLTENYTKSARGRVGALMSGFKKMNLDMDMPYKDLKIPDNVLKFTRDGSPDLSNRAYNFQTLEKVIRPVMDTYGALGTMEDAGNNVQRKMYPELAGAGNPMGTQRTGLAGERPMQGLLPKEDLDLIYEDALPKIESEYGKSTRNLLEYHKLTSNRPEQLLNLKKSDIIIREDQITVKGKNTTKKDHKGRPELTFKKGDLGYNLLKESYESAKTDFLFDTSDDMFDAAFNKHISPGLEKFSDVLPIIQVKVEGESGPEIAEKPVTTKSAIRSIVATYLQDQYDLDTRIIEGIMGHVNPSVLKKNYTGFKPATGLAQALLSPQDFSIGEGGLGKGNFDLSNLTEEQRTKLQGEQYEALLADAQARKATAAQTAAEADVARVQSLLQITEDDIKNAERLAEDFDRATFTGEARKQLEQSRIKKQLKEESERITSAEDMSENSRKALGSGFDLDSFIKGSARTAGIAAAGTLLYEAVRDPLGTGAALAKDIALEGAALALKAPLAVAGAVPMILEPKQIGSGELTDEDRALAEMQKDAGFVNIDRGPEAASDNQEEGFATPPRVDITLDDLPPERQASYR